MAEERKARIALATQGTRGDFQPVLALGIGLAKAGHKIHFFGNPDHIKTAQEFGLEGTACSVEVKDVLASERGRRAMEKGDLIAIGTSEVFEDDEQFMVTDDTDWQAELDRGMDAFAPDLIIFTSLIAAVVLDWQDRHNSVPALMAAYQPHCIPTNEVGPIHMQRLETDPDMPNFNKWLMASSFGAGAAHAKGQELRAEGKEPNVWQSASAIWESSFEVEKGPQPILCAYSAEWWPPCADWPKKNVYVTGNWKIQKEEQEAKAAKGGAFFDAGGQLQACSSFIAAGKKPVYVGWGSMLVFSKAHMARLAVGALKEAGERGIVVGGWAQLSAESLDGAEDSEELKAYAAENVLFLKSAPHEWLFPQCSCAVHHGGIGTAQASLSAGTPTIVTPVFADQSDIAAKLNRERHGVGTAHLSKLTAKDLGAAIRKCCTDETIKRNVKELSERMQKEDGVGRAIEILEKFMKEEVMTGKWGEKMREKTQRLTEAELKIRDVPFPMVLTSWQMQLIERFPVMKEYTDLQIKRMTTCIMLLKQKKLWYVCAENGCLAREGEGLKSPEAGRYKELTILEELEQRGNRLKVKKVQGIGPETGWVSPTVGGKDIIKKFENNAEVKKVQFDMINKPFADLNVNSELMNKMGFKL